MTKFIQNLKQTQHHDEPSVFPLDQIIQAFKKWNESTTTSPSGLHLGHYKALIAPDGMNTAETKIQSDYIWLIIYIIINASIQVGQGPDRWNRVNQLMLEKQKGNHNINKL